MADDAETRRRRAGRLRKQIDRLKKNRIATPAQRPDETDAEYVRRRMREVDRKRQD
jgi:hypothetical protein